MQVLEVAKQAAQAAGVIIQRHFDAGIVSRGKESLGQEAHNLVTDADLESEQEIAAVIRRAFPSHQILGEETLQGDVHAEHLWIVDPIDGTNNFAHQIPHFAVSIAYYRAGEPQCGVVYNPLRNDWYWAEAGRGAWHNGRQVHVSPAAELSQVLIGIGFYYDRGAMMEATLAAVRDLFRAQIHGVRRFGTASLDLCSVGCGHFGAFFEYQLAPWDYAAGQLFVTEAGGRVTNCLGEPVPLAKTSMLASNGLLHDAVLARVASHYRALT